MSANEPEMNEEQLRAAYEEEIKRIRVEHVLLENVVTLINLGMRRTGLIPGSESERDPAQVRVAIESVRVLVPIVEAVAPDQGEPLRQALSQLQMAYVQITGAGADGDSGESGPAGPDSGGPSQPPEGSEQPGGSQESGSQDGPGPAQSSGRLWVPGQ
jgi:hypothetical protein